MKTYCTHADCAAKAAADLTFLAERLRRQDWLALARVPLTPGVEVPCRHDDAQPRPALRSGPPNTHVPLPPRRMT